MNKKYFKLNLAGVVFSSAVIVASLTPTFLASQQTKTNHIESLSTGSKTVLDNVRLYTDTGSTSMFAVVDAPTGQQLFSWGSNTFGQLGLGITTGRNIPTPVEKFWPVGSTITSVHAGNAYSAVLVNNQGVDELWMSGNNDFGQLGMDEPSSFDTWNYEKNEEIADLIASSTSKRISHISCSFAWMAVVIDNELYVWGTNTAGQLGLPSDITEVFAPTKITNLPVGQITDLKTSNTGCFVFVDGVLHITGSAATDGIVGVDNLYGFQALDVFSAPIASLKVGRSAAYALLTNNELWAWGANANGQLGLEHTTSPIEVPTLVPFSGTITDFHPTYDRAYLVSGDELYATGSNTLGRLGVGDTINRDTFTLIPKVTMQDYIFVTGQGFTLLQNDNTILGWGKNTSGEYGIGNTTTNYQVPTVIDPFGIPSNITPKTPNQGLAQAALADFYAGNVLNVERLKKYVDGLETISNNATINVNGTPTVNALTDTIMIKLTVSEYYDQVTGVKIKSPKTFTLEIDGFRASYIKLKDTYPKHVQVHELMNIINPNNMVDTAALEIYFDVTNVPPETGFQIQEAPVYDYAKGEVTLNIRMDQYYKKDSNDQNLLVQSPTNWMPFTLTVAPRLTELTVRSDYLQIGVDKFANLAFNNDVVVINEIRKYVEMQGVVDGAILYLKPGSYVSDTGMGTAQFTVYFDKYYDVDGMEKSQTVANLTQFFDIDLVLKPMTTVITSKTNYTPTHRVDQFISEFTDVDGNVTDETILKQYVDLQHLPTGYTLKIDNVNIIDEVAGTISFNVLASKYNDINFTPQTNGVFPIQLLKLIPKYAPTEISAKAEGDYDDTIRLDHFIELFTDVNGLVTDFNKLSEFVDVISLPAAATLTVKNVVKTDATGKITFDLEASKYYNETSDLTSVPKSYPIILNLGIKYLPTEIIVNPNIIYPERIDRFETKITELSNTADLQTYLAPKYIIISGNLPTDAIFRVDNVVADESTGMITFDLIASTFYDANADKVTDQVIPISLQLRIKFAPTVLSAKAKDDYTRNDRVDRLAHSIQMFSNEDLKTYLSAYVNGFDTLVSGSSLFVTDVDSDVNTGMISFTLNTNLYYDVNSDLQSGNQTWIINLSLAIKNTATTMTAKSGDFTNLIVDQFIPSFTNEQLVVDNRAELDKYVDIKGLPADANLSVKDPNITLSTGRILFKIVADKFYDGESDLITTANQEYIIELMLGIRYQTTTVDTIKGYDQSENVETFVNQIKTLTGAALSTYLATYIHISGDVVPTSLTSIDLDTIIYDVTNGSVSFNMVLSEYYNEAGVLTTNGSFRISLRLAF